MALSGGSAAPLVAPEYGTPQQKHTHAKAGGGTATHTHAGATAGHSHSVNDKLNSSDVALLPIPKGALDGKSIEEGKRVVPMAERQQLAQQGHTFQGTSYPIASLPDLDNAIQAYGRHPTPALKDFLLKEAKRLNAPQSSIDKINGLGGKASSDETVKCPACGMMNATDATCCDQCGAKIPGGSTVAYHADPDETVKCAACGKMNDTDAKFCDQCGAAIASSGKAYQAAVDFIEIGEIKRAIDILESIGEEDAKSASISCETFLVTENRDHLRMALRRLDAKAAPKAHDFYGNQSAQKLDHPFTRVPDTGSLTDHLLRQHAVPTTQLKSAEKPHGGKTTLAAIHIGLHR